MWHLPVNRVSKTRFTFIAKKKKRFCLYSFSTQQPTQLNKQQNHSNPNKENHHNNQQNHSNNSNPNKETHQEKKEKLKKKKT